MFINPILLSNPFNDLKGFRKHIFSSNVEPVVETFAQDVYTVMMWAGLFGAVISLVAYLICMFLFIAGTPTPRIRFENKEAIKTILFWAMVLCMIVTIFGWVMNVAQKGATGDALQNMGNW